MILHLREEMSHGNNGVMGKTERENVDPQSKWRLCDANLYI